MFRLFSTDSFAAAVRSIPIFLTSAAAFHFMLLRAGMPAWSGIFAIALAAVLAFVLVERPLRGEDSGPENGGALACALGLGILWTLAVLGTGEILPRGDPITVPHFGKALAAGHLLTEAYAPGNSAHGYPPGYPILFAPVMAAIDPTAALVIFKIATLTTVALMPAAWGAMYRVWFAPALPAWIVIGTAYVVFIAFERTLGFAVPYAGKNSTLLALVLFPGIAMMIVWAAHRSRLWLLAAIPLYGLALVHYSSMHLAAALLGAYAILGLVTRRVAFATVARIAATGALAGILLLALNAEALRDPRAPAFTFAPAGALAGILEQMTTQRPAFVIFHDRGIPLTPSPWRGLFLLAAVAATAALASRLKLPRLAFGAGVSLASFVILLAFGSNLIPAGVSGDYARWCAWPLQAAIFLGACLALIEAWRRGGPAMRRIAAAAIVVLVSAGVVLVIRDGSIERGSMSRKSLTTDEMREISGVLPGRPPCFLIGDSDAAPSLFVTVQLAPAWNYAEVLTPCTFLNGSWVHNGVSGGRDIDGFPSAAVLRGLPPNSAVFFTGRPERAAAYAKSLAASGLAWTWTRLDRDRAGASVWRAQP